MQVGVDTEITFCLKDLRSILSFCEVACSQLQLSFDQGGSPLVVECGEERLFACTFVLATIATSVNHKQLRHQVTNNNSTWHQDSRSRSTLHSNHTRSHGNAGRKTFEVPKKPVPPPRVEAEPMEDNDVMNEFLNNDVTHNEVDSENVNQHSTTNNDGKV